MSDHEELVRRVRERIGQSAVENMDVFDEEIVGLVSAVAGPAAELGRVLRERGVSARGRTNLLVGMAIVWAMGEDE